MDCFRVETPTATYLYGKRGAGFASLLDKDGRDWISYQPGGKARGEYRGLPKCGQPTKFFHCGYGYGQYENDNPFTSRVTVREADHARIESETQDGKSACTWDFYPDHATLTLLRVDLPTYWFLYEGTPGGRLDAEGDFAIRPDGRRTTLAEPWSQVVPWVCFGSSKTPHGLLLVNHQAPEPGQTDSYVSWPFEKDTDGSFRDMTVFGFGRKGYKELVEHIPDLRRLPARFSIAILDRADVTTARTMSKKLLGTAAGGSGLPPGDARAEGFQPEVLARIGVLLEEAIGRRQIAGGAVLIAHRGRVVYQASKGLGDVELERPIDERTIYRIASMTKPLTSAAVMMLYEDGKIGLDDPVSRYLPEFGAPTVLAKDGREGPQGKPGTVPAEHSLRIRDLLTHTSGLSYRFFDRPGLGALYARAEISDGLCETAGSVGDNVRRLARLPLLNQPGTAWEYGLSTDVLGRVIEVISGQTLEEFLHDRLLRPLAMDDTSFVVPVSKRERLAALYATGPDQTIRRVGPDRVEAGALIYSATYPTAEDSVYQSGGAGLSSTIGDYARFLQMLLNRGELDGVRVLEPDTVDMMTRNQIGDLLIPFANHGDGFGFGFGVLTERGKTEEFRRSSYTDVAEVGTYSWGGLFNTYFWVDPNRQMIGLLMTQIHPSDHLALREQVKRLAYEAMSTPDRGSNREEYARFARDHAGDPGHGRSLFMDQARASCSRCHKVRGEGGDIGPDLTDVSGKFDQAQLIESVLEPSRQIVEGYRVSTLAMIDGRILNGIIKQESESALTLVDAQGKSQTIPVSEIEERTLGATSLMPENLADSLSLQEFTDLVAYLGTLRPAGEESPGSGIGGQVTLAQGFERDSIATAITGATAMEVAPDGRIFVCEQTGNVRVVKDGTLLTQPFVSLDVDSTWERGLLGIAFDPDFACNSYVYTFSVAPRPFPHHRLSRFTAAGDAARPGSEVVLFEGDDQTRLGGNVSAGHQGGAIHFGKDGNLYLALGDQTAGAPAQSLDTLQGKMLRLKPDGSIPEDNPFFTKAHGKYRAIWALGLRNPFTFAVQPGTGRIFINDVGETRWEEIDEGSAGANFGWPYVEGPNSDTKFQAPIHYYPVASIAGGAFCPTDPETNFPVEYRGRYFFADFAKGWIKTLDPDHPSDVQTFATGLKRPVDLKFAPNGSLLVLLRDAWVKDDHFRERTGSLHRIRWRPEAH
jgi:putative heme-binding domain-containing protein